MGVDLRQQATEGNSRLRKELQAEQAERARDWQQLKDLQIANEEMQKTLAAERQSRATDQLQIKELTAAAEALKADVDHRPQESVGISPETERMVFELQGEIAEL